MHVPFISGACGNAARRQIAECGRVVSARRESSCIARNQPLCEGRVARVGVLECWREISGPAAFRDLITPSARIPRPAQVSRHKAQVPRRKFEPAALHRHRARNRCYPRRDRRAQTTALAGLTTNAPLFVVNAAAQQGVSPTASGFKWREIPVTPCHCRDRGLRIPRPHALQWQGLKRRPSHSGRRRKSFISSPPGYWISRPSHLRHDSPRERSPLWSTSGKVDWGRSYRLA